MFKKGHAKLSLEKNYTCYEEALDICNLHTLLERREQLCLKFAHSVERNPLVSDWLPVRKGVNGYSLRSKAKYQQYMCKTKRFQNSAIPHFIKLLNNE